MITPWYWKNNPLLPNTALERLPDLPLPQSNDRIAVVVPHPDDETLASAGYIQRAVQAGAQVCIVMATDGNKRGKKVRRKQEVRASVRLCGLHTRDLIFLDFPDGGLRRHRVELATKLSAILHRFAPTVVLVTDPEDTHPDHAVLGEEMAKLVPLLPSVRAVYATLIHYYRFPRPLGHKRGAPILPPARLLNASPWCRFYLTAHEQEVKRQAIGVYRSQLFTPFLRGLMLSFDRPNEVYRHLYPLEQTS